MGDRSRAPVFVVGTPRSGTTYLYHLLVSSGVFANFRAESHIFNQLAPRFNRLRTPADRASALKVWSASDPGRRTGLNLNAIQQRLVEGAAHTGDFMRTIMDTIAAHQGVPRWSDSTPAHLGYMAEIKAVMPDALFVHVIRDGRDVAVSLARQGWMPRLPGDRADPAIASGLLWAFNVRMGLEQAKAIGRDYIEVRYEELTRQPQQQLTRLGEFVGHELDYERIAAQPVGTVSRPNRSFPIEGGPSIGRWRSILDASAAQLLENVLTNELALLGYGPCSTARCRSLRARALRGAYLAWLTTKHRLRAVPFFASRVSLDEFRPGRLRSSEPRG